MTGTFVGSFQQSADAGETGTAQTGDEQKRSSIISHDRRLNWKVTIKTEKTIHFTTDLKTEKVYADEEFLKEAISNLIDNAIKYSKESVKINISSSSDANHDIINIYDNGIGIPQKDQKKIFEKFERASAIKQTRKGGPSGFGLGLNYVYQVMEAHEGRVYITV